jgi:hypothetical protein
MTFDNLLVTQRSHQEQLGVDFFHLACDPLALTEHIQDHLREILIVLGDVQIMLPLPETSEADQRAAWETYREAYIVHYVRALYQIAGSLTALGCSDRLLWELYDQELRSAVPMVTDDAAVVGVAVCVVCGRSCGAPDVLPDGTPNVILCSPTCEKAYEGAQVISVAAMSPTESASGNTESHVGAGEQIEEAAMCAEE